MVVCEEKKRVEERERKKYFLDVLVFSFSFFYFFAERKGRAVATICDLSLRA